MKKITFLFAFLAIAALSASSCQKDDPVDPKASYAYHDLCMDWGADKSAVLSFMNSQSGWKEEKGSESANELSFVHKSTLATVTYSFDSSGLIDSSVTYAGVNDKFDRMKSDVTSKFSISEWKSGPTTAGVTWWYAYVPAKKCDVSIGLSDSYGGYMYISYSGLTF